MIGNLPITGAIRRRIIGSVLPLFLMLPRRANFKQMATWGERNEGTYHNWFGKELCLDEFNSALADRHGTGDCFVIFDPSFLPKSGKNTPGVGRFWSGQAGAVKRGIEVGCFAVGDLGHRTAFHLSAKLTPSAAELRKAGNTLMQHYVSQVEGQAGHIRHFGNCLAADGYVWRGHLRRARDGDGHLPGELPEVQRRPVLCTASKGRRGEAPKRPTQGRRTARWTGRTWTRAACPWPTRTR